MFRYDQPFHTYSLSNLLMLYCQEEILQRRTEQVEQLRRRWDRLTKSLTFCEIHRFNNDRQQSLASMLGALAATHLQVGFCSI